MLVSVRDVEANEAANFYRESGIRELWYYRSETDATKVVISVVRWRCQDLR